MEKKNETRATPEFVTDMVEKLSVNFYETPEKLFNALAKTILWMGLTDSEVTEMVYDAIFTIKKTKIVIADVVYDKHREKKETFEYPHKPI